MKHMNKWEREQAIAFYRDDLVSVQSLAIWFDRDYNTIGRLMKRAGVKRGNPDFNSHPRRAEIKAPRHGAVGVPKHRNRRDNHA